MIDHIEIDPGRFQAVINVYLNLSLALNSEEAKQYKTRAEYRDYLVIKATAEAYKHIWILLIRISIYGWRIKMEIIIKLDHDEPVKVKTASIYGEQTQRDIKRICTGDYFYKLKEKIDRLKMDLQNRDDEIQDLKLENDRLKQREEIMLHFITSCACRYPCSACDIKNKEGRCHYLECTDATSTGVRMMRTARNLLDRLEDL